MLGKLVPCGGGVPIPLMRPTLVLGRRSECDITIPCGTVSSRHCVLEWKEGYWWVRDLESKNGTTVNGQRAGHLRIDPKAILAVGRQRLVVDYSSPLKPASTNPSRDADEDMAFDFLNDPSATVSNSASVPSGHLDRQAVAGAKSPTVTRNLGKLVPCGGGPPIPLRAEELILGRGRECDIRIRQASVSSRHCKLRFEQGYWLVEDLHSTNGTWVDGDRCMLECLMPDSVLALDKHRFTVHYTPSGDGSPPIVRQLFSQSLLEKAGLANQFTDDRLAGMQLPDDDFDRPKRYNLLDSDDE